MSKPKKSSRWVSASFFSAPDDTSPAAGATSPWAWLQGALPRALASLRRHLPKAVVAFVVLLLGCVALNARMEKRAAQQRGQGQHVPPVTMAVMEVKHKAVRPLVAEVQRVGMRVREMVEKMPKHEPNEEEASLYDVLWLLLASVVFVPAFQKLPGGSPVLGYLAAGALIGPYALSIIKHVHGTKALAEFGVVFLMFNIGLELSLERLNSMRKYVFGLGSAQSCWDGSQRLLFQAVSVPSRHVLVIPLAAIACRKTRTMSPRPLMLPYPWVVWVSAHDCTGGCRTAANTLLVVLGTSVLTAQVGALALPHSSLHR
ncbi:unnamed protein product [Closterium sp. Yama58-4]|nr:unnamed protein product [Closterium sp. Yama58-4]